MATIFQKIFLPKSQWVILDFIKDNHDSVEYRKTTKQDQFHDDIGTTHRVSIRANDKVLVAELTTYKYSYPFRESDVSYTFSCKKPCEKQDCILQNVGIHKQNDNFAFKVYTKMLNNYIANIAKNGCPCER